MIELKGFGHYTFNLETNEVFTKKGGLLIRLEPCKDSVAKCWYLYRNGERVRKTVWILLLENIDKIEIYARQKSGVTQLKKCPPDEVLIFAR